MLIVGTTLDANERRTLRTLVERVGVVAAVSRLGVSREPITRAIAGIPVRRGTVAILRSALSHLGREGTTDAA
jgi:hypothetical protein